MINHCINLYLIAVANERNLNSHHHCHYYLPGPNKKNNEEIWKKKVREKEFAVKTHHYHRNEKQGEETHNAKLERGSFSPEYQAKVRKETTNNFYEN